MTTKCNVRQPKQNFVEIQKVCYVKKVNSKWLTWQVQKIEKQAEKRTEDNPTPPRCANDKQKRASDEGEGREFQCCATSTRKMPGKTRKRRTTHQWTLSRTPKQS